MPDGDAMPRAVLLDAGGVFVLPEQRRIVGALGRAGVAVEGVDLVAAHYRAAATFGTDLDPEHDWAGSWRTYLEAYVATACPDGVEDTDEVHRHLDSEFADAALWCDVVAGAVRGLRSVAATGVALGVVSNADGLIAQRLRDLEVLQVGPGLGVEVGCVIDSGEVGVMKPDPRIFELALTALDVRADEAWYVGDMPAFDVVGARRAGVRPFLMDPLELHVDAPYDRVGSLGDLATLIRSANG
jgi:putative hydrolase of the HAD superfamily